MRIKGIRIFPQGDVLEDARQFNAPAALFLRSSVFTIIILMKFAWSTDFDQYVFGCSVVDTERQKVFMIEKLLYFFQLRALICFVF